MTIKLSGQVRTRASQAELDRAARAISVPVQTPSGESRTLLKLVRAWAEVDAMSAVSNGDGSASWEATLRVGRLNGRGAWIEDETAEGAATPDAIGGHILRVVRLVKADLRREA